MLKVETERLHLTTAAFKLGWRYWKARDALLAGDLQGGRSPDGGWWVSAASVEKLLSQREAQMLLQTVTGTTEPNEGNERN